VAVNSGDIYFFLADPRLWSNAWPGFGLFLADPTLYQLSRGCQLLHTEAFQVLILAYTRHIEPFFTLGFTRHFRQPHLDQM
jgi:hypothetical protein